MSRGLCPQQVYTPYGTTDACTTGDGSAISDVPRASRRSTAAADVHLASSPTAAADVHLASSPSTAIAAADDHLASTPSTARSPAADVHLASRPSNAAGRTLASADESITEPSACRGADASSVQRARGCPCRCSSLGAFPRLLRRLDSRPHFETVARHRTKR